MWIFILDMERLAIKIILFCLFCVVLATFVVENAHGLSAWNLETYTDHECNRACEYPPSPKTCHYNFTVEWFYAMSKACYGCPYNLTDCERPHCIPLNGVPRSISIVNRMFPGPSVEVCKGDTISVWVKNHLKNGEGTSIHWHGFPQKGSPYMDGVSMVTQCPITEFSDFRYEMIAEHAGTHWWHAHSGMHRADGVFGALIVREPRKNDVHSALYDYDLSEHTILTHDWLDQTTLEKFAAHHFDNGNNRPEAVLINGKGKRAPFYDDAQNETVYTPREIFHVNQDFRYRFRIISNAITNAPLKVSVDNHILTIIASDGGDIEPIDVDAFVIYGGERFDFVLNANQSIGNYWMRVKGVADAIAVQELAIVRYEGALSVDPTEDEVYDREGIILQELNEASSDTVYTYDEMISKDSSEIPQENKKTFYIAFDFYKVNNYNFHDPEYYPIEEISRSHHLYSPQLNHVSFKFVSSPPLSQWNDVDASELCEANDVLNMTHCATEYCECTHVITVDLGETVELVLIDEGVPFSASHPFHLHGYSFRVIGQEKLGTNTSLEYVMKLDLTDGLERNLDHAPLKDTVIVPDGGYTIVQFVADNPGWWFLHCHLEFHVAIGMGLLIHVGTDADLPPVPENFPRCGTWPPGPSTPIKNTEEPPTCGRSSTFQPAGYLTVFCLTVYFVMLLRNRK